MNFNVNNKDSVLTHMGWKFLIILGVPVSKKSSLEVLHAMLRVYVHCTRVLECRYSCYPRYQLVDGRRCYNPGASEQEEAQTGMGMELTVFGCLVLFVSFHFFSGWVTACMGRGVWFQAQYKI